MAVPRTIGKHVPEMAVSVRRAHLGANHAVRGVSQLVDVGRFNGLGEARPAGSRFKLVGGCEQRLTRHNIDVDARFLVGDRKIKRPFPPTTAPTPCWGRPAHPAAGRPLRAAGHRQAGWLGTGCRHGWSCSGIGWSSTNNIRTGFGGGISHFQSNQAIYLNRTTVNDSTAH